MMRAGGTKGTMEQCLAELKDSELPADFKLTQVRSLLRYLREVGSLVTHVKRESGFDCDTTAYLEILCAKEDSNLLRRVSDTRILKQDFDEKRREWRRTKKNIINAISEMSARALKFECSERKTIALHAIQYYKYRPEKSCAYDPLMKQTKLVSLAVELAGGPHQNVMANDDGAIPGESESTDGLIDQYRRHRDEISKIPMYADSIMKMLKDIRRTVNASSKLQPGSNAFTQFLDEWWASVVNFLQHSSIVDAERNAREVMQTLKKLKGKQEENKKREMTRLMSKLDAQDKATPPITPITPASHPVEIMDDAYAPEDTGRWNESERSRESCDLSRGGSTLDGGETEHEYDGHDEGVDEVSEMGGGGGGGGGGDDTSAWSSPTRSDVSLLQNRVASDHASDRGSAGMAALPFNVGTMSVASWDVASEPTGTDAGTDQDVIATSGLPEEESDDDDDDEDDDEFEAADSLDLGAVALCATGTGTDGQQTYQDATRTPQAMRHMTNKLGVEQKRFSAALDYFRQEQRGKGRRPAMPPPPPGPSRSKTTVSRGREATRVGQSRGRRLSAERRSHRDFTLQQTGSVSNRVHRAQSLYISSSSRTSSTHFQASASARKRTTRTQSTRLGLIKDA